MRTHRPPVRCTTPSYATSSPPAWAWHGSRSATDAPTWPGSVPRPVAPSHSVPSPSPTIWPAAASRAREPGSSPGTPRARTETPTAPSRNCARRGRPGPRRWASGPTRSIRCSTGCRVVPVPGPIPATGRWWPTSWDVGGRPWRAGTWCGPGAARWPKERRPLWSKKRPTVSSSPCRSPPITAAASSGAGWGSDATSWTAVTSRAERGELDRLLAARGMASAPGYERGAARGRGEDFGLGLG